MSRSPLLAKKSRIQQENEAIILPAALHVFSRKGFKGTTMADIAEKAGLPKGNLFYYFSSKQALYQTVLEHILEDWLTPLDSIHSQADPRDALELYVRQKMAFSFDHADASRLFAGELLQGAPSLQEALNGILKARVAEKVDVLKGWIAAGRLHALDCEHFFFSLWSMTQTYADFSVQVEAVMGHSLTSPSERERATRHVLDSVFRMCGLESPQQ